MEVFPTKKKPSPEEVEEAKKMGDLGKRREHI
jgi:hypothetical protein